ncbi:hypothetical protein [Salinibacter ruber]|uniref:hypothetical protein n=1 Tax=Salinibacter ruber TaxID=146919 RepID=UPI001608158D|nr:hypothetical protein [Salinibacter ruber]MBB4090326.1 hypothetical protein [Salinibacter ruber]
MNTIGSSAAGRAAYTQGVNPSQESPDAASGPEKSASGAEKSSETQQAPDAAATQEASEDALTTQERRAIEENFPEDPELSMRLYGRGRGAQTVNPNAVGGNLDVTG